MSNKVLFDKTRFCLMRNLMKQGFGFVSSTASVVYSQVLRSSKHIYKSIYIHRWYTGTQQQWRVTTYLRGGGTKCPLQLGVGVAQSATPTAC